MEIAERLKIARREAGFARPTDAARALGMTETTYIGHENGLRGFRADTAELYARRFKVSMEWLLTGKGTPNGPSETHAIAGMIPIVGKVAAGVWLESDAMEDEPSDFIPYMPSLQFPVSCYFGLIVTGKSMNKTFADGASLLCLDVANSGITINDGDIAIIERLRHQDGIRELTAKRVRKKGKTLELWPESTAPQFQHPIRINGADDDESIVIKARVVGVYSEL